MASNQSRVLYINIYTRLLDFARVTDVYNYIILQQQRSSIT